MIGDLLNTHILLPSSQALLLLVVLLASFLVYCEIRPYFKDYVYPREPRWWRTPRVTPSARSWSNLADKISYRFRVAGQMDMDCRYNPIGARAMRKVIMTMGDTLDIAVENRWAEKPTEQVMAEAERLWAFDAAQKQPKEGEKS